MSKIKKFLEFFDDENLKASHEIDFLTGKIHDLAKTVNYSSKDKTIEGFISKVSYSFPFMSAFTQASNTKDGKLEFPKFKVMVKYQDGFYNFITSDETNMLSLGIRILGDNKYDISVMIDDSTNDEDVQIFEKSEVSYDYLCSVISSLYIQSLIDLGFEELIKHKFDDIIVRSN